MRPPLFMDSNEKDIENKANLFKYEHVCMGGTFDHMHQGHRLLLAQACLITKGTLHCGVAADELLAKKAYAHLIEPLEERKKAVEAFLKTMNPHIKTNVFKLEDACGVGATMKEI